MHGSIPACTGNPWRPALPRLCRRVYPRVYGESCPSVCHQKSLTGLSPRVRGIPGDAIRAPGRQRSIPACTGNPFFERRRTNFPKVYPRVYGESGLRPSPGKEFVGLSPRVRGILPAQRSRIEIIGSIPACTGNPTRKPFQGRVQAVYPRVYGESAGGAKSDCSASGLSPRVRGIPCYQRAGYRCERSIPACTGNPRTASSTTSSSEVYPRVYGESHQSRPSPPASSGLSPRVRGIREQRDRFTESASLSPRVRGILGSWDVRGTSERSIPACTGNPRRCLHHYGVGLVYPRVYGESDVYVRPTDIVVGLSPRVRGIPRP